jgi:hypothetical protein
MCKIGFEELRKAANIEISEEEKAKLDMNLLKTEVNNLLFSDNIDQIKKAAAKILLELLEKNVEVSISIGSGK